MKDLTKKELELLAIQTAEEIINNGENCLELYIESKRKSLFEATFQKAISEAAFDERALYGSDLLEMHGVKSSISNTGDRLQYDKDPIIAELKLAIKEREKDVKLATKSTGVYFDSEGVQVEKVPVKYGMEVLKIQF
tara:strand:+ start:515 stop:925 length:411 start_codon:yes stop_codon:yes gene_type:complete